MNPEEAQQILTAMDQGRIVWDDNLRAQANNALRGYGAGGAPAPFSFDYEAEATKAYGELGAYYDRILREAKGDVNKALARLVEDYETGKRTRREDVGTGLGRLDVTEQEAQRQAAIRRQNVIANALSRGLYQRSAFAPQQGFGIPSANLSELESRLGYEAGQRGEQRQDILTRQKRADESALLGKTRTEEDLGEKLRREEFDLEQRRRREAGELANIRGGRAYQKYQSELF